MTEIYWDQAVISNYDKMCVLYMLLFTKYMFFFKKWPLSVMKKRLMPQFYFFH